MCSGHAQEHAAQLESGQARKFHLVETMRCISELLACNWWHEGTIRLGVFSPDVQLAGDSHGWQDDARAMSVA